MAWPFCLRQFRRAVHPRLTVRQAGRCVLHRAAAILTGPSCGPLPVASTVARDNPAFRLTARSRRCGDQTAFRVIPSRPSSASFLVHVCFLPQWLINLSISPGLSWIGKLCLHWFPTPSFHADQFDSAPSRRELSESPYPGLWTNFYVPDLRPAHIDSRPFVRGPLGKSNRFR